MFGDARKNYTTVVTLAKSKILLSFYFEAIFNI